MDRKKKKKKMEDDSFGIDSVSDVSISEMLEDNLPATFEDCISEIKMLYAQLNGTGTKFTQACHDSKTKSAQTDLFKLLQTWIAGKGVDGHCGAAISVGAAARAGTRAGAPLVIGNVGGDCGQLLHVGGASVEAAVGGADVGLVVGGVGGPCELVTGEPISGDDGPCGQDNSPLWKDTFN